MSNQHTPAPWKIATDKKHIIAPVDSPVYFAVAEVLNWETDQETTQANARLIAAAPELLEALQALRDSFIHDGNGKTKGNQAKTDMIKYNEDVRNALNLVRQVIDYKINP